jgi:hypothetical protein
VAHECAARIAGVEDAHACGMRNTSAVTRTSGVGTRKGMGTKQAPHERDKAMLMSRLEHTPPMLRRGLEGSSH